MELLNNLNLIFERAANFMFVVFFFVFSLLYIIYAIVYIRVVKILNQSIKTKAAWFFDFLALIQLVLGILVVFLTFSFIF